MAALQQALPTRKTLTLGIYEPLPDEPSLSRLVTSLAESNPRWRWALPKVRAQPKGLEWIQINPGQAELLAHPKLQHLLEPVVSVTQPLLSTPLDGVLIPALALDRAGYRLGYGQGYYDRWLNSLPESQRPLTIGVTWSPCIVDTLPHDDWDIPLDWLLSEQGLSKAGA